MGMTQPSPLIPRILVMRGRHVILDSDLASLFGVSTKRLNEQIRRNAARFPEDFAFRLRPEEAGRLRSQFATSNAGRGGRRYLPLALTEHGVVMAANVVNSPRAVLASVEVVRAFVRLRRAALTEGPLAAKLEELARAVSLHLKKHDREITRLFEAVEALIAPGEDEPPPPRKIGFSL
ncbi:MAG: ORF6N domain-containing protein [Elusimicrobia bacterium]|nr:ORF6N domain-containing protein [Elusimicrobiota bacterium]